MKTGLTVKELASKIQGQNESKADFIANTDNLWVVETDGEIGPYWVCFDVPRKKGPAIEKQFEMSRFMLQQIANHTNIPMKLVDLMHEGTQRERTALAELMSVRLQENPTARMIRTMDNEEGDSYARAFLSDRYRRLDNFDLAGAVFPLLKELDDLKVMSSEITETKMYVKMINSEMSFDIGEARQKGMKVKDIIEAGVVIGNSEVGQGSLFIDPFIHRIACLNGMISRDHGMKKYHVGQQLDSSINSELLSEETLSLNDAGLFSAVSDTVRGTLLDDDKFLMIANRIFEAKDEPIIGQPVAVVEELGKRFSLNEDQTQSILNELITEGDLTKFGLAQAITAYARDDEDVIDYETATSFEQLGGQVIEMGNADWRVISESTIKKIEAKRKRAIKRA